MSFLKREQTMKNELNNQSVIDFLPDVDDDMKQRFKLIEKCVVDGKFWKTNDRYNKTDFQKICLINGNFKTSVLLFLFGTLYYLYKGLWLKAIVYTLVAILVIAGLDCFFDISNSVLSSVLSVWCSFVFPFDFYRFKVLGKQW